jgi:hypothetical protein
MAATGLGAPLAGLARRRDVRALAVVTLLEVLLLGLYVAVAPAELTTPRYALYPFVWINAGLLAVYHVDVPAAPRARRAAAAAIAALYLLVLLYLAGLVGLDLAGNPPELVGIHVGMGSPGWERVRLIAPTFHLTLIPYRVIGYVCLAFLVYATVLRAAGAALSGAVGLFSCVSCSFPIFASLASGVFGGSAALTGTLLAYSVDLSTVVFLLALGLLYWQPGVGWLAGE